MSDGDDSDPGDQMSEVYVKKKQGEEIANLRQGALIEGMRRTTSGAAQDCLSTLLDIVSQSLILGQLYINIRSIWGGEGCRDGKAINSEAVWFYTQMALNILITVFQLFLWLWMFFTNGMFCSNYGTCPTTEDANQSDVLQTFMVMKAKQDGLELAEMDDDERADALRDYKPEPYDEEFQEYKKELKTLGRIATFQASLTAGRLIIGSIGAIVEPALVAYAGLTSADPSVVAARAFNASAVTANATKKGQDIAADIAAQYSAAASAAADEVQALKTCMAVRQLSACGSGLIAAIGVKQQQIKAKYTKLVLLNQMRDKDIRRSRTTGTRKVTDAAIASEIQGLLGAEGKTSLSYLSGKQAPPDVD